MANEIYRYTVREYTHGQICQSASTLSFFSQVVSDGCTRNTSGYLGSTIYSLCLWSVHLSQMYSLSEIYVWIEIWIWDEIQWYAYKAEQIAMALYKHWIRYLAAIHIVSSHIRYVQQNKVIHQGRKCKHQYLPIVQLCRTAIVLTFSSPQANVDTPYPVIQPSLQEDGH